jgi:mannose-6-phosphate isomerase-like protein (cupin superfamily)
MMTVTYGKGFEPVPAPSMVDQIDALRGELEQLPQYEPETTHRFHGGMYCREVWRPAGVLVVGKVHRQEHFYVIVSGTVLITTDDGAERITGPTTLCSKPGTRRAVFAETDALCMTFHRTDATTVEAAEEELVEPEQSGYAPGNRLQQQKNEVIE